jgi:hypothetical protein
MLDDKCKFYQIYNVCSFPAPKEKEKGMKSQQNANQNEEMRFK